jgi:lipoprotein-anchoring transpeptidase ErfK/SrfK
MSRHRDDSLRLRPARAVGFVASLALTLLAVVGAAGMIPTPSVADTGRPQQQPPAESAARPSLQPVTGLADRLRGLAPAEKAPDRTHHHRTHQEADDGAGPPVDQGAVKRADQQAPPPAHSGSGRRVVFDVSAQHVWLVRGAGSVLDSYPVSGSTTNNLKPGRYAVYSRSAHATSYDYASTMRWMVRFTEGARAAIGFHSIPRDLSGEPVQTVGQLGTPQSHGCIRQRPRDAKTLWDFAPLGTRVVVVR